MESLVDTYKKNVSLGKIQREKAQEELLTRFDALRVSVEKKRRKFLFSKSPFTPKGIYVWGGVGCGKSMIMDMFVASLKVAVRRVHFHSFMQEVQSSLNLARQSKVKDAFKVHIELFLNNIPIVMAQDKDVKNRIK